MQTSQTPAPPIVMVFGATDPSGAAGLSADVMTLVSMGCHPLSVVTAVTVQDTAGIEAMLAIDAEWVADQARMVLEDMPVAAFKLGLLASVENIAAIAEVVSDYPDVPLVLDPVLISGNGDEYASEESVAAMRELLLPQTTVLTPDSLQARRLAAAEGEEDADCGDAAACARAIVATGAEYVLLTGARENTAKVINTLYGERGPIRSDAWERLPGSFRGAGCTLASALAANLANGLDVAEAARDAQDYTWQALSAGFRPGMGRFLPDRFFWARGEEEGR